MRFTDLAKLVVLTSVVTFAGCSPDRELSTDPAGQAPGERPSFVTYSPGTVTVQPTSTANLFTEGWFGYPDRGTAVGLASIGLAPTSQILGNGSLEMSNSAFGWEVAAFGNPAVPPGTDLGDITALSYATYTPSGQAGITVQHVALQFTIDYDLTDSYAGFQGRLVYEPYLCNAVALNTWTSWSTLDGSTTGCWWQTANPSSPASPASSDRAPWVGNVRQTGALPCPQSNPCTWTEVQAAYPNAGFHLTNGATGIILKVGTPWVGTFYADALVVGVSGTSTTYDFEPATACTTVCYTDAATGDNAFGGDTPATAKKTIQAALNQVSAGGQIRVLPGTYNESAPGSTPTSLGGTYQFGLFFGSAKPGITLIGVTAADVPVTNAASTLATINTNATNNFGYSGIFIEANNTTIQGVSIGPNTPSNNKSIEVVADNFTLRHSATAIPGGGAVYLSEFDPPAGAISTYHILDNRFTDATQIAISSGAGQGGAVSGREIKGNTFALGGNTWPAISFNGTGGVPWYTKPVGGAIITGNSFSSGGLQYIRARGTYTEAEFDWESYWNDNTYDKGTVALVTEAPFNLRTFSYVSVPYTFTNVRRIGTTAQGEVDNTMAGDVVLAKAGTYPENVSVPRALTLKGAGIGSTVLQGTAGAGTGISLAGGLSNVTIGQLTAQGYNYGIQMPTGPLSNVTVQDVATINNTTHGIWVQAFGITNMAFTRVNSSGNNSVGGLSGRGIWIINGVKTNVSITGGTYNNNGLVGIDVSDGTVTGVTITGNTVTGNRDAGIGVLGAQGSNANLVANNVVTNNGRFGIEMKIPTGNGLSSGGGSIVVSNNVVARTVNATDARDYAGIAVFRRSVDASLNPDQPSGVVVTGNTVSGFTRMPSGSTGDGFGIVVEGIGHIVTKNVVSGTNVGIQIQAGNTANVQSTPYFDRGNATPSSALINRNSITSNTDFDLRNVGALLTDATCNWYGAASGPVAARISGSVTTEPWLLSSNLNGACTGGGTPVTDNVAVSPNPAPYTTSSYLLTATATDNSSVVAASYTIDGGTPVAFTLIAGQSVALSATLGTIAVGVYNICVTATDDSGLDSNTQCTILAVYDPNNGFVTGGGWFNSPAGAYAGDPNLTGKATFGFVSKYVKGRTLPTGNTEFQFKAGSLNFSSSSYEWLVVNQAGSNAQFKGAGTINGAGNYTFMLWATDGDKDTNPLTLDTFRIKIWDTATQAVVYDNGTETVIGGGNIMVQTKK